MNEVKQVLIDAKALIANPANWTTGAAATTKDNEQVTIEHKDAVCFCTLGAVSRAIHNTGAVSAPLYRQSYDLLYSAVQKRVKFTSVASYNDGHTHQEVMELFDEAIAEA